MNYTSNSELIQEEKQLLVNFEKWSNTEEQIWKQKARIDWLQLGDSNTKFFHAYIQVRKNTNVIHRLVSSEGVVVVQAQIKQEIKEFYQSLMGTAAEELIMVDKNIMSRGPELQVTQQKALIVAVTGQEVKEALFSMDSSKAPNINKFNVYFFKKCWHIIGEDVIHAVQQFFSIGDLPKEVNMALITLIPKYDNASVVKDFKPIACCTVLYKIISKILSNRLKVVLDTIISDSQSTFVKGRLIFDNIILNHELIKSYTRKQLSRRCMMKVDI